MSPLLRSTYISILTTFIALSLYAFWVFSVAGISYFSGPEELVRIGKAIGILILAGYGFEILAQLGAVIIDAKIYGRSVKEMLVDERDKLIVYRSIFLSTHVLCTGIFISIGALAFGFSAFWVFNIIVLFYGLAIATELTAKLVFLYRGVTP